MNRDHSNGRHALFYLGLALLAGHELDAVGSAEWRLMPGLDLLADATAETVFIALHIPLFALVFWLTGHRARGLRTGSQRVIDVFLIIHAGLHAVLSGDAEYHFETPLSDLLIFGGAAVGALHLAWSLRASTR